MQARLERHQHLYKEEIEKLDLENRQLGELLQRAQGEGRFLKEYLQDLLRT